jgi:hypothetical protein
MEAAYAVRNPVATKAMIRLLGLPVGHCRPPLPDPPARVVEGHEGPHRALRAEEAPRARGGDVMEATRLDSPELYHLRLGSGDDVFEFLRQFLLWQELRRIFVLSAIGTLGKVVVNFRTTHEMPPQVGSITLEGRFEINGISGGVARRRGDPGASARLGHPRRVGAARRWSGRGRPGSQVAELVIAGIR